MKIEREGKPPVIVGKRITVGGAIGGIAAAIGNIWPDQAQLMLNLTPAVVFVVQLLLVNLYGVTSSEGSN